MSAVSEAPAFRQRPAAPYGLLGLLVSTTAILVIAAVACGLGAGLALAVALATLGREAVLAWLAHPTTNMDPRLATAAGLGVYGVLAVTILAAARWRAGERWRDVLGWAPWNPFGPTRRLFALLLVSTLIFSLGADYIVTTLDPSLGDATPHPAGLSARLLFLLLAALAAPMTEELLFRGWIYTSLRVAIGIPAAIIVSAALFAIAHWESTHLYAAAIFPVGLVLGLVRERTGSLAASIAFHALYNAFASTLLFTQS